MSSEAERIRTLEAQVEEAKKHVRNLIAIIEAEMGTEHCSTAGLHNYNAAHAWLERLARAKAKEEW